ncbi:PEP-CTERM sorting domain-containing protein [Methylomicrobium sp. RS1]|jgi:hypothetical protein|uniref:PEP-CTERM sorting domain-containing protein n=1 Tax=Candidatus Methylomicrobium oryzae TaxID=2802053 RepID=UPI001922C935|nr:PEP-CTERM sorting domain-containing protein [Methylomicrobium sp. RS1]
MMTVKKIAALALTLLPAFPALAQTVPVPEPEILPLFLVGTAAFILTRRSKKR